LGNFSVFSGIGRKCTMGFGMTEFKSSVKEE